MTPELIVAIATLARLALTEEEKRRYADQLSVVFGYIEMLGEVDVTGVPETCQVTGLTNIIRHDIARDCDAATQKKLISAFPEKMGELLKVKAVFEHV